ncbi:SH3 and multiple ankyrin repeat domains protein 1 [Trichogramma pretiosum]|uniref:SH3 and multiple ankyrin repeat domains protein 1 n=1 Tax=Trichogramma pretiosum TaxID=7493 RepID=UPI0006C9897F|nr:SH3 and multiple ankyrin repeat domains protein 1 [Trichogramma pretiosum]
MRGDDEASTPYCRCRVLYLGSAVPHASKEGLLGVQEPLRELYPEQGASGARGIDSWLSVWSNGLLLENVDENRKKVTRFFPIESLHYCAAVRHVRTAGSAGQDGSGSNGQLATRFLPLDSPFTRSPSANHPPLFAAVLRRTSGIKVLECHAFICKRDMAANALVRCCFHAHADSRFAKGLEPGGNGSSSPIMNGNGTSNGTNGGTSTPTNGHLNHSHSSSGSLYNTLRESTLNLSAETNGSPSSTKLGEASNDEDEASLYNGNGHTADENHKVWARGGGRDELDALYQEHGTLRSQRRPRQLIAPPPPPPPPPAPSQPLINDESNTSSAARKKAAKKLKKMKKDRAASLMQEEMMQQQQQPIYGMNGHNGPIYANGHHPPPPHHLHHHHHHHTLGHPMPRGGGPPPPPGAMGVHYPAGLPPSNRSIAGTLARPAPTPLLLVPASTLPRKGMHPRAIRPIPAAAPIVPIYAPLPPMGPPGAPLPAGLYPGAGYGTTGNRGNHRRSHAPPPGWAVMGSDGLPVDGSQLGGLVHSRRIASSHADLSQQQNGRSSDSPDNESRFGTGIYRRKGHLNERAFSYSIRAEHRSRSHGSLASLGFAGQQQPNGQPNGHANGYHHHSNGDNSPPAPGRHMDKKEREMQHLLAGLTLEDGVVLDSRGNVVQHVVKNGNGAIYMPQPMPRPRR